MTAWDIGHQHPDQEWHSQSLLNSQLWEHSYSWGCSTSCVIELLRIKKLVIASMEAYTKRNIGFLGYFLVRQNPNHCSSLLPENHRLMSKPDFMVSFLHSSHLAAETTAVPNQCMKHNQTGSAAQSQEKKTIEIFAELTHRVVISLFIDGK